MIATYLILPLLALYPVLPGHGDVNVVAYYVLVGVALAGAVVIEHLPWERLFAAGTGDAVRYAWSVLDILLVTAVVEMTGGAGGSPMFMLYALTTIYFAASYPRQGQIALLAFTFACYGALIPGSGMSEAVLFARLSTLAVLAFMGSFISGELMAQISEHAHARAESDRRANLVAAVAEAASRVSVLEPDDVLEAVVDCVSRLGLESAELRLLEGDETFGESSGSAKVTTPVWVQGRVVAVLEGSAGESGSISQDVVEAMELLGALAGRALENAQRFEDERRMVERLAEVDRLKSDFISTASHELRTPLTVVLGMATTLLARWETLDDETRIRLLGRVESNAQRLEQIVNSLLDFSRIESGALEAQPAPLNLGALAQGVADRLAPLFAEHLFEVDIDLAAGVEADARLLERIIENLLGNAAKHTEAGTPVRISVRQEEGSVVLEVCDEGTGIDPDDLDHLTERFFRGGDPNTRTSGGLGLGLAIVREILLRHGTALEIDSTVGRGTRFGFRLPAVPAPAPAVTPVPGA